MGRSHRRPCHGVSALLRANARFSKRTLPMKPRRRRPTYANVTSTLALFVALGGTSYAAATISGSDVRDHSLTGRDVTRGSLSGTQIRSRSIPGGDLAPNSVQGSRIRNGTIQQVDLASPLRKHLFASAP